jgi:hypothetical protein
VHNQVRKPAHLLTRFQLIKGDEFQWGLSNIFLRGHFIKRNDEQEIFQCTGGSKDAVSSTK